MTKDSNIKLAYHPVDMTRPGPGERWEVIQVTDSIAYSPGEFLNKQTVKDLCALRMWNVTIIKPGKEK